MFAPAADPLAQGLDVIRTELDDLTDVALFTLTDTQLQAHLIAAEQLRTRLDELALRLVADCQTRGLDTKTDLVRAAGINSAAAHRRIILATGLAAHQPTRTAMARAEVSEAQAQVILDAVAALPVDDPRIGADVPRKAEHELITLAAHHSPRALKILGAKILEVAAPEVADEILGEQLQREHDKARRETRLTFTDNGRGRTHLRGTIPTSVAAIIKRNLLALLAPKHVRATTPADQHGDDQRQEKGWALLRKPSPERWGQAFVEWIERYRVDQLPRSGGIQARAIITLDHAQLLDLVGASTIATIDGIPIPAGDARRLACEAGILPLVLGGASVPLDLGRGRRFYDTGQRLAIEIRDKTCTTEGCDVPAARCHAHHELPWSEGGGTSVDTGRLLCPHHHHMAHHPRWQMTKTKHGQVAFIRR